MQLSLDLQYVVMDSLKVAVQQKDKGKIDKYVAQLKDVYNYIHNKDYDHEVDRKVMKRLIPIYGKNASKEYLLPLYQEVEKKWKVISMLILTTFTDNSIFSNDKNFNKFISKPTIKAIDNDPYDRLRTWQVFYIQ